MCNKLDNGYRNKKQKLAEDLLEHTLISWVGVKHRKKAHSKLIYKYNNCTIDELEISGNKLRKRVETLLKANHINNKKTFIPKVVNIDIYNWRNTKINQAYVDFETIPHVLIEDYTTKDKPITDSSGALLYLIGIWYCTNKKLHTRSRRIKNNSEKWQYKYFLADRLDKSNEIKIISQFTNFVRNLNIKKLFHWGSSAEPAIYRNIINKYNIIHPLSHDIWNDMCTLFIKGNIGIKGSTSYGLKNIAKAMYKHGMINYIWNDKLDSGFESMISIYKANNISINNNIKLYNVNITNDIIKYNMVDCKILHDIITYIRNNH